jgi:hypothetical protein
MLVDEQRSPLAITWAKDSYKSFALVCDGPGAETAVQEPHLGMAPRPIERPHQFVFQAGHFAGVRGVLIFLRERQELLMGQFAVLVQLLAERDYLELLFQRQGPAPEIRKGKGSLADWILTWPIKSCEDNLLSNLMCPSQGSEIQAQVKKVRRSASS